MYYPKAVYLSVFRLLSKDGPFPPSPQLLSEEFSLCDLGEVT